MITRKPSENSTDVVGYIEVTIAGGPRVIGATAMVLATIATLWVAAQIGFSDGWTGVLCLVELTLAAMFAFSKLSIRPRRRPKT